MTTSQQTPFLSEILKGDQIPNGKLAYFRARLSNRIHELVLSTFLQMEKRGEISRAELARRLGKKPEQITRWLGAPGNWTMDTVSDLLLGMACEPALSVSQLKNGAIQPSNHDAQLGNAQFAGLRNECEFLANRPAANEPQRGLQIPSSLSNAGSRIKAA